jgi:radical SAM superfamily enzyme YgiQ (UPF0313 family)
VKSDTPNILLVNPWIHDFAAFDFWAKPMGLLGLAAILRDHEYQVHYIDCLDRFHPKAPKTNPRARHGRGPYLKTQIPKPETLEDIPRTFSRYGIKPEWFMDDLRSLPQPDLVLVTSFMTYWYPGVKESISTIKKVYPDTPVLLGGIYASLCKEHAERNTVADRVITGPSEASILDIVGQYTGLSAALKFDPNDFNVYPYPAYDLQNQVSYIPIATSKGCPFACAYCAARYLNPKKMYRTPDSVVSEIRYWSDKYDVRDFVFYDDALLVDADNHALPLFEKILYSNLSLRFHTPNAVHILGISQETARMMYRIGFKTLRLGLETTAFHERSELDRKVTETQFKKAVSHLKKAGFENSMVGAYLLAGLPSQDQAVLTQSINTVLEAGISPVLAYYSPIPHTQLWDEACLSSRYDLAQDPIFTNNAIMPCQKSPFSWQAVSHLKLLAHG